MYSEDSTTAELFDSYITFPDMEAEAVLKEKSCVTDEEETANTL